MKRLSLLAFLITSTLYGTCYSAQTSLQVDTHLPYKNLTAIPIGLAAKSHAVAFDIDGVLLAKPAKLATVWNTLTSIRLSLWPSAFKHAWNNGQGSLLTWAEFCYNNGAQEAGDYLTDMILNTRVLQPTHQLATWLDDHGYKIFLASNQDQREFALQITCRKELSDLAHRFTDGMRLDASPGKKPLQKPDAAYFRALRIIMQRHCPEGTGLVFIDDRHENVKAAQDEGFIGVHCKDPAQLPAQLRALGINCPLPVQETPGKVDDNGVSLPWLAQLTAAGCALGCAGYLGYSYLKTRMAVR